MKKVLFNARDMVGFISQYYANFYGVPRETIVEDVEWHENHLDVQLVSINIPGVGIRKFSSAFFKMASNI